MNMGELWRKDALYEIMDGKSAAIPAQLTQDPDLKKWRCQQAGDECVGFTLLHGAIRFRNVAALDILLANGAVFILAKDKAGKTPFDWAILNSEPVMLEAMLACAASGATPMPNLELALKSAETQHASADRKVWTKQKTAEGARVAEALGATHTAHIPLLYYRPSP